MKKETAIWKILGILNELDNPNQKIEVLRSVEQQAASPLDKFFSGFDSKERIF